MATRVHLVERGADDLPDAALEAAVAQDWPELSTAEIADRLHEHEHRVANALARLRDRGRAISSRVSND